MKQKPEDRIKAALRDLTSDESSDSKISSQFNPPLELNLQPEFIYIPLVMCLGFKCFFKPMEKVLFVIPFKYKNISFCAEYGKFGFRLYSESSDKKTEDLANELFHLLKKVMPQVNLYIYPTLERLVKEGKITISNEFNLLDQRYRFFREAAIQAYNSSPPEVKILKRDSKGNPTVREHDLFKSQREGYFFGVSAIDAYFARLEHFLVLALPFSGFDISKEDLSDFIGSKWSEKFKRIVSLSSDKKASKLYKSLRDIKERFRNFSSHGNFMKGLDSFLVHFEQLGAAIPVKLSEHKAKFSLFPLPHSSFEEVCALLDELDTYLSSGDLRFAWQYALSGLSVGFDSESLNEYEEVSTSDEDFEEYLKHKSMRYDYLQNMDW